MSNSLSDQLLRAGLITQDQIEKSEQDKQQRKARAKTSRDKQRSKGHSGNAQQRSPQAKSTNRSEPAKNSDSAKKSVKKEGSDLAKFYQQRNQLERSEREAEEQQKREAAARRKKTRKQIRELVQSNLQNTEEASIRFNFVVGETVKYLYVTEAQQQALAEGKLSITFLDGKRSLIPVETGTQILALDPEKIVVNFSGSDSDESNGTVADESESL